MLSPNSPALPDPEAGPLLLSCLAEVAENSLFAFCDPASREGYLDGLELLGDTVSPDSPATWLHAVVAYTGDAEGSVELALPVTLARELGAAFAGEDDPAALADAALRDFVGEVANMVCGLWLTRRSRLHRFDLSAPAVTPQSARACASRALEDMPGRDVLFATINDAPVWLSSAPAPRS